MKEGRPYSMSEISTGTNAVQHTYKQSTRMKLKYLLIVLFYASSVKKRAAYKKLQANWVSGLDQLEFTVTGHNMKLKKKYP